MFQELFKTFDQIRENRFLELEKLFSECFSEDQIDIFKNPLVGESCTSELKTAEKKVKTAETAELLVKLF